MHSDNIRLKTVVEIFNKLFAVEFNTLLLGGAAEPAYIPAGYSRSDVLENMIDTIQNIYVDLSIEATADVCSYHRLYFREDFVSSALHESAHWCIAGAERRRQVDFGYWYSPDGRSQQQQEIFEQAESKPQALEWMFSQACGQRFRISADNLAEDIGASEAFIQSVALQAQDWCPDSAQSQIPIPVRGEQFLRALAKHFDKLDIICADHYHVAKII